MPAPWGQHFLADAAWRERVAGAVGAREEENLVEIGGGTGELSALVAGSGCQLTVVEIDPALAAGLRQRFAGQDRVQVLQADILALDWRALAAPPGPCRLFGNLPYYITAPILLRYFRCRELFCGATVMVQQEIAARLTAVPGPGFGRLSAAAQFFSHPVRLFDLPPGAFHPRPQVWSSLVRLEPVDPPTTETKAREAFLTFLRLAFAQKRKRLANNLKAAYSPTAIPAAFAACGLAAGVRAEQCPAPTLWRLFRALQTAGSTLE